MVPLTMDATGTIHVTGSRVTLDTLVHGFKKGESPEHLASSFPTVSLAQLYAILAYYLDHRDAVVEYLRQRAVEAEHWRLHGNH